jgi:hypothetical protein
MAAPVSILTQIARFIASLAPAAEGSQTTLARSDNRGELIVENLYNGMQAAAMEGSYFLASTATPGTGITASVATGTTFSDTQALLLLNNTDSPGGKSLILDFIAIICTTAPTNTTAHHVAHRLDAIMRGTAGTQLGAVGTTPKSSNGLVGTTPVGQIYALGGSGISVAGSAAIRNVGRNLLRAAAAPSWQAGDIVVVKFGSAEMAAGGVGLGATTPSAITVFAPPIVVGPGQSYAMNEWAVARSAALSAEFVAGWIER